jgi:hypothetical protein
VVEKKPKAVVRAPRRYYSTLSQAELDELVASGTEVVVTVKDTHFEPIPISGEGKSIGVEGVGGLVRRPLGKESLLSKLAETAVQAEAATARLNEVAAAARAAGATWPEIGEAVGITSQAAHQRWSATGRERHREAQRRHRERS